MSKDKDEIYNKSSEEQVELVIGARIEVKIVIRLVVIKCEIDNKIREYGVGLAKEEEINCIW